MYSRPLPSRKGIAARRLYQSALEQGTVETPISDQPKCKDLVVAYGRWSLTRIKPQGASSKKWSRHICCMEDHLSHAISKLDHVQFHVVTKVLRIFKVAQCTQRTKRSENTSSGCLQEVKNNRKSSNFHALTGP